MGFCSKRHFLLTICTLQLITTIERQVFDFLGFMWVPILVNFFNIIFVILGFFGAFQYRPKYIISYIIWNVLWLGWNIFLTCFYLSAGVLDKNSDLLNLGTGSFSWWQINGPGCKPHFNNTAPDRPDVYRPVRPDRVTGCVLDYEIIEVLHSSTQCLLAVLAIIGGICLSRAFLEEDDSFDFVGGGDFGMAGHTPLHPMYVSYSALPPPAYTHNKHTTTVTTTTSSVDHFYPNTNTGTTTTSGSHRSSSITTLITPPALPPKKLNNDNPFKPPSKKVFSSPQPPLPPITSSDIIMSTRTRAILRNADNVAFSNGSFNRNDSLRSSNANSNNNNDNNNRLNIDYADYSNPIDHIPMMDQRRCDYDTLEMHSPNLSMNRQQRYYQRTNQPERRTPPISYSPLMRSRQFNRGGTGSNSRNQNRNSYRPRIYADHIREQQPSMQQPRLRSFHSDPRLSVEEQNLNSANSSNRQRDEQSRDNRAGRRDGRPLSMFVNNY